MISRRLLLRGLFTAVVTGAAYKLYYKEETVGGIAIKDLPVPTPHPDDKATTKKTEKEKLQYIVVDADTGTILVEHNAKRIQEPASLTKLMSLTLVFEAMTSKDTHFNMNSMVTIPDYINRVGPGIAVFEEIKAGKSYKAKDLLIGAGSRSDAYSTLALAIHLGSKDVYNWGGTEEEKAEKFLALMNKKAADIGMNDTNFAVITGLPNRKNVSTAYDMALLIKYIRENYPKAAEIALGKAHFDISSISKSSNHTSRLLKERPNEIEFAKTGYTNRAGYNLAVLAKSSGKNLIGIVMGADGRNHRNAVMKQILKQAVSLKKQAALTPN